MSISNLFSYEKDVEHAKLGDLKKAKKENMPYRKVTKGSVDECLRVLARRKVERATPSLRSLQAMLAAYVADLSAGRIRCTDTEDRDQHGQKQDSVKPSPDHHETSSRVP